MNENIITDVKGIHCQKCDTKFREFQEFFDHDCETAIPKDLSGNSPKGE